MFCFFSRLLFIYLLLYVKKQQTPVDVISGRFLFPILFFIYLVLYLICLSFISFLSSVYLFNKFKFINSIKVVPWLVRLNCYCLVCVICVLLRIMFLGSAVLSRIKFKANKKISPMCLSCDSALLYHYFI